VNKRLRDGFTRQLLCWFGRNKRDLPWRQTRDPWAIWVSEVMLQQTRVEAVREHYPRFLQRYPTPAAFARVTDDELLRAWRGLGYYRRARLLRAGAQAVMERHGGRVPADPEALADLPGIGPYTKGALASIAFDLPELAVDGNVERVTARHRGIAELVKSGPGSRKVRAAVRSWQDPQRPGDFNQALMQLGATICTPRTPRCLLCPVAADCHATQHGLQDQLPALRPRRATVEVHAQALLIDAGNGKLLAYRVPDGEINAGQVDLPGPGILVSIPGNTFADTLADTLADTVAKRFGIRCDVQGKAAFVHHGITHHKIRLTAHWATFQGRVRKPLLRAAPTDPQVPWTTTARKVFHKIGLSATDS
jgi:A/G-specific adenine glycosylase